MSRSKKKGRVERRGRWALKLFFKLFLGFLVITLLGAGALRWINPPCTAGHLWKKAKSGVWNGEYSLPTLHWTPLENISPHLLKAVLTGEDQRFWTHHGFDLIELNLALREMATGERFRGASTLSMQVARTLFLWPGRSMLRKILEAYFTVIIEVTWDKKRILEMYVNMVDWGPEIVGIEAASRIYFKTRPYGLNREHSAMLAAILPNPHRWSPNHPTAYVKKRQQKILRDMNQMQVKP